jgi:hypothetical protein
MVGSSCTVNSSPHWTQLHNILTFSATPTHLCNVRFLSVLHLFPLRSVTRMATLVAAAATVSALVNLVSVTRAWMKIALFLSFAAAMPFTERHPRAATVLHAAFTIAHIHNRVCICHHVRYLRCHSRGRVRRCLLDTQLRTFLRETCADDAPVNGVATDIPIESLATLCVKGSAQVRTTQQLSPAFMRPFPLLLECFVCSVSRSRLA